MKKVRRQWPQRCSLLWLLTASLAPAQVGEQPLKDRLAKCKFDVNEAREIAKSVADAHEQKPEEGARKLGWLGARCAEGGRYGAAESLLRSALAVQEKFLGPEHPDTATSLNDLAWILNAKGEHALAEPLYRRALAIREKVEGPGHPATAMSLNNLAELLRERGDYAASEPLHRRALAIRERTLGPEDPDTATSLNNLASLLAQKGDYAEAELLNRRALAIREKILGPEHTDTATSLNNLALLLVAKGDYAGAEPLYRRALAIQEKTLGAEHPDTATSLNNLASLLVAKGDYAGAEPLYRRAITVQSRALGPNHPAIAISLNNLAGLLDEKGQYEEAESIYRRALTLQQRLLGAEHPDIARTLSNLAHVLAERGDYAAAEPLDRQVLAIREKVLGPTHPDTLTSLNNLAALLATKGDYAGSELLFRQALALREKVLGPEHPDIARDLNNLNNLAALHATEGDYRGAELLFRQALALHEKVLGPEHPGIATDLNNLAVLLAGTGEYAGAEPLYRRALAIQDKSGGPENPKSATILSNLAELLAAKGATQTAEQTQRQALAIREKVLEPENPEIAQSLNHLALLLALKGQYAAAEPAFRRALAIAEKALGPDHPKTIRYLYNLAALMWAEGRSTEARVLGERASRTEVTNLSRWLMPYEETKQRAFLRSLTPLDMLISFQLDQPQDKEVQRDVLWALLQRQGRLQEIRAVQQRLAARQPELFQRWQFAQRALEACLSTSGAGPSMLQSEPGPCSKGAKFGEMYQSANEALLALYAKVPREEQDLGAMELVELLGSLRDGGWVLVEIAQYSVFQPYHPWAETQGGSRYAAYLLFPDGRIEFKDLGEVGGINAAVTSVRKLEADPTSNITSVRAAARELYERTLGQFDQELKYQGKLYVAADGDLGLVDFSSLVDGQGRWFIENHLVANLTSGRDLVRLKRTDSAGKVTHGDYLIANPSFLFKRERVSRATAAKSADTEKPTLSAPALSCSEAFSEGASWPSVGITTEQIAGFRSAIPGLKVLERQQAREGAVKQIEKPRSLWFITHGFFCANSPRATRTDSLGQAVGASGRADDDPMARGALVLAGAQVGGTGDGEDGFLQANEIVVRDWEGTDLVVLGACETALGVPSVGDGVYGMRRALTLAGVRSQVMTLWRVSQAPTFELLRDFASRLKQGKGKAEALREAQRQMLRKHPHPYYWAGFHFTGDPAPFAVN